MAQSSTSRQWILDKMENRISEQSSDCWHIQAMTGCILLHSLTIIIGRHLFFMFNVQQSVVIQIRNVIWMKFLWHAGKMDVYVDMILKKHLPYKNFTQMVGFVDKIYSICQLIVAIVENKVYVAIRLVLVMYYNWCPLMVGFVESQNTP